MRGFSPRPKVQCYDDIHHLVVLVILSAGINTFNGTIPQKITELTNLSELWLMDTWISGELPKDIGNMKSLGKIFIFMLTHAAQKPAFRSFFSFVGCIVPSKFQKAWV